MTHKKINPDTYKSKILRLIGITGQLQSNRSSYYFPKVDMFRKYVRELLEDGYIKEIGLALGNREEYIKDYKCLVLDKKGRKFLEEYFPEIYKYYTYTNKTNTEIDLSPQAKKRRLDNKRLRAVKKAILKIENEELKKEYLKDYEKIHKNTSIKKFIEDRPLLYENYEFKNYDDAQKRLMRVLKNGDVLGFLYNNNLGVIFDDKVELDGKNKNSLIDCSGYFYQSREIKAVIGEKIEYAKLKGVIFHKNKTIIAYNIPNQLSSWELSHEEKLLNCVRAVRKRKFIDFVPIDCALFFSRDYDNAITYFLPDKKKKSVIEGVDPVYHDIYYIPLLVNDLYSKNRKNRKDCANETLYIILNNINEKLISNVQNSISKNKENIVQKAEYLPVDFIVSNKYNTEHKKYYLSFFDSNIAALKRFINFAMEDKKNEFILLAFDYQMPLLSNIYIPECIDIKYTNYENINLSISTRI